MKNLKLSTKLASAVLGKELVSEVLNIPKEAIVHIYTDGNYLLIRKTNGRIEEYNIYGFAFKCKEWIINKEYHINTSENRINNYIYLYKMIKSDFGYEIDKSNGVQFDSKGYINNLFEACEWILEQNK